MTRPISPRMHLIHAQSEQFETSGELRGVRVAHAEAIRLDDAEQPYVVRLYSQILMLPEEYQERMLATFLARETRDVAQRRATERAIRHAERASRFQRAANGLVDLAMDGLNGLLKFGKRRAS